MTPVRLQRGPLGLESSTLPLSHCAPYIRRITQVLNLGTYLNFTVTIVTVNGCQSRLKIEKLPFRTNFDALGNQFFKN